VRSESRNKIILAVLLSLLTAAVFAAVVASVGREQPEVSLQTLIRVSGLILVLWALLTPLALLAARRLRQLTVIDTVLTMIVFFFLLQILLMFTMVSGSGTGRIVGTPCNGGMGRKVVVAEAEPGAAGAIYWSCIPIAEYKARRQAGEDLGASIPTPPRATLADVFGRLLHIRIALRSLVFGIVVGLSGWFYAFGWCWRMRRDSL
jgi:hypothetical protein